VLVEFPWKIKRKGEKRYSLWNIELVWVGPRAILFS